MPPSAVRPPEPKGPISIFLRSSTDSHGRRMWIIRWQFAQRRCRSATFVFAPGESCEIGVEWWHSMNPSPTTPYRALKSKSQASQTRRPSLFKATNFARMINVPFRSLERCARNNTLPSGNSSSSSTASLMCSIGPCAVTLALIAAADSARWLRSLAKVSQTSCSSLLPPRRPLPL